MAKYFFKGDSYYPNVNIDLDNNIFEIKGVSRSEDSFNFYNNILDWLTENIVKYNGELELKFQLTYINSASTKMILRMFKLLSQIQTDNSNVKFLVKWYYTSEDEDMLDVGSDLAELSGLKIETEIKN